jgi:hypothetical protein
MNVLNKLSIKLQYPHIASHRGGTIVLSSKTRPISTTGLFFLKFFSLLYPRSPGLWKGITAAAENIYGGDTDYGSDFIASARSSASKFQDAINSPAIIGPRTKPLMPKNCNPPSVVSKIK